jgi:NADPH2:quinone reductase
MRAIQLPKLVSSPDELSVTQLPDLRPSPDKYLVKIHAAAANFFDNLQIQGKHQQRPALPFIAGNEFSGEVLATPSAKNNCHNKFKAGDRVFGAGLGAFATQILVDEADIRPVPKGWTYVEASSLFYTAPTAYAALVLRGRSHKGEKIYLSCVCVWLKRG